MMDARSAKYEIIRYRSEHRGEVLALQAAMWSPDLKTNAAYLDWKYYNNPFNSEPIIYLALHEGQVVGMRAAFGTTWEGGRPARVMQCVSDADAIVHPKHRRRGLLSKMTAMTLADLSNSPDYAYSIVFSANQLSSAHGLQQGWRVAGPLEPVYRYPQRAEVSRLRKFARWLPVLPSMYRRLRSYVGGMTSPSSARHSPFATLDSASTGTHRETSAHIRVEKQPRPEAMADLVERIGTDGRIRHVRNQRFFAWRFQNPLSEYRFFFWEEDRLEGYLVLQTPAYPKAGDWVTIVDWEATSAQVRDDLVRTAIQQGDFDVLTTWSVTLENPVTEVLRENGFRLLEGSESPTQTAFRHGLYLRPILSEELEHDWEFANRRLLDMSSWDLRAIYSDNY